MSSINTNIAAMTALQSLQSTSGELLKTQNKIATGLRVATASDNAAYWSIATTMRSDRQAITTVLDAIGLGTATIDTASKGLETSIKLTSEIKTKIVAARSPGIDRDKIQTEISQLQSALEGAVASASFSGQNWLAVDSTGTTTRSLVSSFSRDASNSVSVNTISVDIGATGSMLIDTSGGDAGILDQSRTVTSGATYSVLSLDISGFGDDAADLADIEDMLQGVDDAITSMTRAATSLGAVKSRLDTQKDAATKLIDAFSTGIGQLVDADMNEESTRLQALQVRQQLGVQALSLANQSSQAILSLFR